MPGDDATTSESNQSTAMSTGHERHCFIVMPFGRDSSEQKWFRGWYEVVIKPAVIEADYEPKLAAAEEQPGAINDEIRAHLTFDPMVVVDLGGAEPEDEPNPNVMYELGIRHALGLPLVILAWKGQRLPFDVSNQRVIMEDRDLVDLEVNRNRLVAFIHAAQQGRYYRPMDAVGRIATIAVASESLGEDSLLRVLAQEVRDLRTTVDQVGPRRKQKQMRDVVPTVKKLIRGKVFRKELFSYFQEIGGDPSSWAKLLRIPIPMQDFAMMQNWGGNEWKDYIARQWAAADVKTVALPIEEGNDDIQVDRSTANIELDEQLLVAVKDFLPAQPWSTGVHRSVALNFGITNRDAAKYIAELIRQGEFLNQVDGQLCSPGEAPDHISDETTFES